MMSTLLLSTAFASLDLDLDLDSLRLHRSAPSAPMAATSRQRC